MKRPFRYIVLWLMLAATITVFPQVHADAQINSTIRVWLRRLQVEDVLRISVQGSYMLDDGSMTFSDGAELSITLRENQLVLHTEKIAAVMGDSLKLIRCGEDSSPSALKLNALSGLYEGDLHLDIEDGVIRPVLHIHIEDYLLGVVPYEMGDSFPLEALKAQAIAARTYALQRSGRNGAYDVEDTTNDQAYKGRSTEHPLSEQAVRETEGLCGTYKERLADCYYSASNGGQTELGDHVWPVDDPDAYGYMSMRDDPFDYENDASSVKRYTIKKTPGNEGVGTALHSAVVAALKDPLEAMGYVADDQLVRIDEVVGVNAVTPRYKEPSRLMTELSFELRISVREYTFRDTSAEIAAKVEMDENESVMPIATPQPTATPSFSPFVPVDGILTVKIPVFPTAEQAMGLSINVYQNELIRVFDIGSAFMLESRRFGHGVGMSQRGAQQMAAKYGMTYQQILNFYYPGMEVKRYDVQRIPLPTINIQMMATPAPSPSPTPRPTLMPVTTDQIPEGAYFAVVSNISDGSSLNLRESPSLSSDIIRRLYKEQKLIVLSASKDGWARVKTDVVEGYVRSEYLQTIQ